MNPEEVLIVSAESGDWQGLYIDGELAGEGHTLTIGEVLNCLGIYYETRSVQMDPYKFNHLPQKATDLPEPVE